MNSNLYKQILEAFIAEAKISGANIEEISVQAKSGILGNKNYTWINEGKAEAIELLEKEVDIVNKNY